MSQGKITFKVQLITLDKRFLTKILDLIHALKEYPSVTIFDIDTDSVFIKRMGHCIFKTVDVIEGELWVTIILKHLNEKINLSNCTFDIFQYAIMSGKIGVVYRKIIPDNGCLNMMGYEVD